MASHPPALSFEFFPAKTAEGDVKLWQSVQALAPFAPAFVSVTYGAGGSTQAHTHETVRRIRAETALEPAAHLTCVGASRAAIDRVAMDYWEAGIRHIVALRGDPPQGAGKYAPHTEGYAYACDLIEGLRALRPFEISVAAFPDKHPESDSYAQDIEVLKRKEAAGATRAITQYFFEPEPFLRLRDAMVRAGVGLACLPGLIPIGGFAQLKRFSALCGAVLPDWLAARFEPLDADPDARDRAAVELAGTLAERLMGEGVTHLHFYTLNRADLTGRVCRALGVPEGPKKIAALSS